MPRRIKRKFLASEALTRGVRKKHFSGAAEAGALSKQIGPGGRGRGVLRDSGGGLIVSLLSRKTGGTEGTGGDCVVPAGLGRGLSLPSAHALG